MTGRGYELHTVTLAVDTRATGAILGQYGRTLNRIASSGVFVNLDRETTVRVAHHTTTYHHLYVCSTDVQAVRNAVQELLDLCSQAHYVCLVANSTSTQWL